MDVKHHVYLLTYLQRRARGEEPGFARLALSKTLATSWDVSLLFIEHRLAFTAHGTQEITLMGERTNGKIFLNMNLKFIIRRKESSAIVHIWLIYTASQTGFQNCAPITPSSLGRLKGSLSKYVCVYTHPLKSGKTDKCAPAQQHHQFNIWKYSLSLCLCVCVCEKKTI